MLQTDSRNQTESSLAVLPGAAVTVVVAGVLAAGRRRRSGRHDGCAAATYAGLAGAGRGVGRGLAGAVQLATDWLWLAAAVLGAVFLPSVGVVALDVLAVAWVLAAFARLHRGASGRAMLVTALAAAVLGIFRLAEDSIPFVAMVAQTLGQALGWLAGRLVGRPLWIGAAFGGIDLLVLMATLAAGWLASTSGPRKGRALKAAAAILAGQFVYLVLLAFAPNLVAALPKIVPPPPSDNSLLGLWTWSNAVRTLLPWNLPAVALLIQACVAAIMFRSATWLPVAERASAGEAADAPASAIVGLLQLGSIALALLLPPLVMLAVGPSDLKGRTVVVYDLTGLDGSAVQHERRTPPAANHFEMLPILVESLGGRLVHSAALADDDLAHADVLVLLASGGTTSGKPAAEADGLSRDSARGLKNSCVPAEACWRSSRKHASRAAESSRRSASLDLHCRWPADGLPGCQPLGRKPSGDDPSGGRRH